MSRQYLQKLKCGKKKRKLSISFLTDHVIQEDQITHILNANKITHILNANWSRYTACIK